MGTNNRLLIKAGRVYAAGPRQLPRDYCRCATKGCPLRSHCARAIFEPGICTYSCFVPEYTLDGVPYCESFIGVTTEVGPCAGGCWYCGEDTGDLVYCHEFDTMLHLLCLEEEIDNHNRGAGAEINQELEIIAAEFHPVLKARRWALYGKK